MDMNEVIKQKIEGTDDLSMARGLVFGLLETLTSVSHELTYALLEGLTDTKGFLDLVAENIDFINHNTKILRRFATEDFETLCANVRKSDD